MGVVVAEGIVDKVGELGVKLDGAIGGPQAADNARTSNDQLKAGHYKEAARLAGKVYGDIYKHITGSDNLQAKDGTLSTPQDPSMGAESPKGVPSEGGIISIIASGKGVSEIAAPLPTGPSSKGVIGGIKH
jgi:hypothetical protein